MLSDIVRMAARFFAALKNSMNKRRYLNITCPACSNECHYNEDILSVSKYVYCHYCGAKVEIGSEVRIIEKY